MATDLETLARNVQSLVNGWHERVEYRLQTHTCDREDGTHTSICFPNTEDRVKTVRHSALLLALRQSSTDMGGQGGGHNANKPGSRPPGNMAPLNLIDCIREEAVYHIQQMCMFVRGDTPDVPRTTRVTQVLHNLIDVALSCHEYPQAVRDAAKASGKWVSKSRCMLGYDKPYCLLRDMVCGKCGGALMVASDASTDVRCVGKEDTPACGQVYPRWQWLDLLKGQDEDPVG